MIGRDNSIKLPQPEDYADGKELVVYDSKSPEVTEIIEGLVRLVRDNDKFIIDMR